MSRSRAVTSPAKVLSTPAPLDLEGQAPLSSGSAHLSPDHNARSPGRDSSDLVNQRLRRSKTSRSYRPKLIGRQWKPGEEPGLDPHRPHSGAAPVNLHEECQITVVDYSQNDMEVRELNNEQLVEFMEESRDETLTCRWINVNGLSWDVISLLGREKKFHRLALEDMLNRRNRTKADWYSDHTYMVLPLQKLVHIRGGQAEDIVSADSTLLDPIKSQTDIEVDSKTKKSWAQRLSSSFRNTPNAPIPSVEEATPAQGADSSTHKGSESGGNANGNVYGSGPYFSIPSKSRSLRTLQRYQGGHNIDRIEYMEMKSAIQAKGLAVTVEQVSIFLTSDNTVVSFFEASADDIEAPIINRLSSRETVLRRSSDASMLVQAILDAIIDLAIPVTAAYKDAIDELELNVLTSPAIEHAHSLYILISEIGSFRSNIAPVASLVNALRDHKAVAASPDPGVPLRQHSTFAQGQTNGGTTVVINPSTYTYLGDVEDHILLINDGLDQMRRAADNMIDLIFNTISAYQNETMKQLTTVTLIFLPLTFITGYFGMNFQGPWPALQNGDYYFWEIAVPVSFVVTILLLYGSIKRWWIRGRQRWRVRTARKRRSDAAAGVEAKEKRS